MVCGSCFLALHCRRSPIEYLSPIPFFSYLFSSETNFLLVFHLSAPGTHDRSRMPSLALGVERPSWPYAVLSSPLAQSIVD